MESFCQPVLIEVLEVMANIAPFLATPYSPLVNSPGF